MANNNGTLGQAEFLTISEIAKIQQQNWRVQRNHLIANSVFYQRLWDRLSVPKDLRELSVLPIVNKNQLRQSQLASPPFGEYLAVNPSEVIRFHRTSGSTGQAVNIAQTQFDATQTAQVGGRSLRASGLKPNHLVIHCLNYQMWMGGVTDHLALEAVGATVIPFGIGNSKLLIQTILDLGIDAIHSTPSYPAVLEQSIAENFEHLRPKDLNLKLGLFGGEAGLDNRSFRQRLKNTWGYAVRNANYGVSDVFSNFAGQCELNNDLHFVGHDVLYPELVDPSTLESIPWQEGSQGELVLTHLARKAQPLVRFRTNDMIVVTATDTCACGRTTSRFRVMGRTDDMIVIRGVNVYPTAIGGVLNEFSELSGEFRIRIKGVPPNQTVTVQAEKSEIFTVESNLLQRVEDAVRFSLRVTAPVELLPPKSLPRTEGKTTHIIRED